MIECEAGSIVKEREEQLVELGWDDFFVKQLSAKDRKRGQPGRIVEAFRKRFLVHLGDRVVWALARGAMFHRAKSRTEIPTVGDWVIVEFTGSGDDEEGVRLWRRLERRSLLVRQAAGEQTRPQVIAANIDTIFVTCAIHKEFNVRRVERYLALVEESGATPVVILNKADLVDEDLQEQVREQIAQIAPGVDCIITSMKDGRGVTELEDYLEQGHTIALIGSSGVGKSTLINELHGEQIQATGAVREQDGKGRHTTTTRQLVVLPSGGLLVDTPGMRELGLWQADESALEAFPEIERLGAECKFRDCLHESEVGCAVKRAVEDGELEEERVESWRKLKSEIEFQRERQREIERIERRRGAKISKNKSSS